MTQAGTAKRYFHGLPSPAAGLTLATYYWFSQTPLYTETNIVNLPWHAMLRFLMLGLGALMVSEASYPAVPTVGFRNVRQMIGSAIVVATIVGVFFVPKEFFFPALLAYDLWGLARLVFFGLIGRRELAEDRIIKEPVRRTPPVGLPQASLGAFESSSAADLARRKRRRRRRRPNDRGPRPQPDDDAS